MIEVESEDRSDLYNISTKDLKQIKKLMEAAQDEDEGDGEWPDEVNDILDKYNPIPTVGTLNTMGDGWGWYGADE